MHNRFKKQPQVDIDKPTPAETNNSSAIDPKDQQNTSIPEEELDKVIQEDAASSQKDNDASQPIVQNIYNNVPLQAKLAEEKRKFVIDLIRETSKFTEDNEEFRDNILHAVSVAFDADFAHKKDMDINNFLLRVIESPSISNDLRMSAQYTLYTRLSQYTKALPDNIAAKGGKAF